MVTKVRGRKTTTAGLIVSTKYGTSIMIGGRKATRADQEWKEDPRYGKYEMSMMAESGKTTKTKLKGEASTVAELSELN